MNKLKILCMITITILFNATTLYAKDNFCALSEPHQIDLWQELEEKLAGARNTDSSQFIHDVVSIQYEYYDKGVNYTLLY